MRERTYFDYAAIAVIISTIIVLAYRSDIFPIFIDIYYHLSIMEMFSQAGGVVAYDFLQYAPFGRPHLYPPLLHVLMLAMDYCGISAVTIGKIVSAIMYPATLICVWYFVREHYRQSAAFFTVVLLASSSRFFNSTSILSTCALATICAIWTYHFILREKKIASIIFFTFCLYSHLSYPHLIALSLLLWAAVDPKRRSFILTVIIGSYILALPWLLNVALNRSSLSAARIAATSGASVQLLSLIAAIAGCFVCIGFYKKNEKSYIVPLMMLGAMVPIAISYPTRFITHSSVPLSILGGIGIGSLLAYAAKLKPNRRKATYGLIGVILLVFLVGNVTYTSSSSQDMGANGDGNGMIPNQNPETFQDKVIQPPLLYDIVTNPNMGNNTNKYPPQNYPHTPDNDVMNRQGRSRVEWDYSTIAILLGEKYDTLTKGELADEELLEAVILNTSSEDIIITRQGTLGAYITAYTGRATTSGMFHEVSPDDEMLPYMLNGYETYTFSVANTTYNVIDIDDAQSMPSAVPSMLCFVLVTIGIILILGDIFIKCEKNEI